MITYKIDLVKALEDTGYSTYRIRQEKIMGQVMLRNMRNGEMIGMLALDKVCEILGKQPGDIIEYRKDNNKK